MPPLWHRCGRVKQSKWLPRQGLPRAASHLQNQNQHTLMRKGHT
jgi:hypothetical protein